jgi:hypothetical protein
VDEQQPLPAARRKRLLAVIFIPSVERDGTTEIDQARWVDEALNLLGRVFGGATAYPRAQGIWRDDENNGRLVRDNPVVVHCYMVPEAMDDANNQALLGAFCRKMGREANQGEVGLVIADEYLAITDFTKE